LLLKKIILPLKKLPNQTFIAILVAALFAANTARAADELTVRRPVSSENANDSIVPVGISDAVSDVDMRMRLAAKPNAASCVADICLQNQAFDARVQQLGTQLSAAAYAQYPTLKKRTPNFVFSVVDKKDAGSASNAGGKVVLFRGLQQLELTDDALSFVMAREMAHVIGKHHNKNTSTKLIISALATILFPAVGIIGASSAATQATTATTLLTSAASTATSMLGSEVALAKMKPTQLVEADEIAVKMLSQRDWNLRETASVLQLDEVESTTNSWLQDLQTSQHYLQQLAEKEDATIVALETESVETDSVELNPAELDSVEADQADASIDALPAEAETKLEAAQ
jgi:Zn-dependent protease with chaperone function